MSDPTTNAAAREALIAAGLEFPGVLVISAQPHHLLDELAQEAADLQAMHRACGHPGWGRRFHVISQELGLAAAEIAAQSWDRQRDDPLPAIGVEMWKSWSQSRGHWAIASRKPKWFGAAMSQGKNGIWYAAVIAAG